MSTISSQLLVTSSSLTGDFYQTFLRKNASQKELIIAGRVSVTLVASVAIYLAYDRESTILTLVSNAWAGFGAAFGPVILFSLYWKRMTRIAAISGMLMGAGTVLLWIYTPIRIDGQSLSEWIYEIVPGFIACSTTILLVSMISKQPEDDIKSTFEQVKQSLMGKS